MNSLAYEFLENITPIQVRRYLSTHAWMEDGEIDDLASIWHRPSDDESEYEVLLPEKCELRDFKARMKEVIENLAAYEKRQTEDILNDIAHAL